MFEQRSDIVLHLLQLIELKVRVRDGKYVPSGGLFVNENALAIAHVLFFDFEQAFALQHDRQDVTGIGRNLRRGNQPAKQLFCGFFA